MGWEMVKQVEEKSVVKVVVTQEEGPLLQTTWTFKDNCWFTKDWICREK